MAQELVLRSISSFLGKGSNCIVTRRTLFRQHDGNDRLAVVSRSAEGLEPDQRRRVVAVVVADVDPEAHFRAAGARPTGGSR
jgi:hypothetical protein